MTQLADLRKAQIEALARGLLMHLVRMYLEPIGRTQWETVHRLYRIHRRQHEWGVRPKYWRLLMAHHRGWWYFLEGGADPLRDPLSMRLWFFTHQRHLVIAGTSVERFRRQLRSRHALAEEASHGSIQPSIS